MKRSKELKTMARMQLAGKYSTYIGAYALFYDIRDCRIPVGIFPYERKSVLIRRFTLYKHSPTDSVFCDRIDCFPDLIYILPGIQQNVSGWKPWLSGTV